MRKVSYIKKTAHSLLSFLKVNYLPGFSQFFIWSPKFILQIMSTKQILFSIILLSCYLVLVLSCLPPINGKTLTTGRHERQKRIKNSPLLFIFLLSILY